jgi:uncharacterized protein (TIGR03067 family)
MFPSLQVVLGFLVLGLGDEPGAAHLTKEWGRLKGDWVAISGEVNGHVISVHGTLNIERDTFTWLDGKRKLVMPCRIDPTNKPLRFDICTKIGPIDWKEYGNYEINGDELKLCYAPEEVDRPRGFSSSAGTVTKPEFLLVYKRR